MADLTLREAIERFGIPRQQIHDWVVEKKLPLRFGDGTLVVSEEDLERVRKQSLLDERADPGRGDGWGSVRSRHEPSD
jgi:hypothetical protein